MMKLKIFIKGFKNIFQLWNWNDDVIIIKTFMPSSKGVNYMFIRYLNVRNTLKCNLKEASKRQV